jgi:sulfatase modifying factor 1
MKTVFMFTALIICCPTLVVYSQSGTQDLPSQIDDLTGQDNTTVPPPYKTRPPVHQWIALQALLYLSNSPEDYTGLVSELENHISFDTDICDGQTGSSYYDSGFSPPSSWDSDPDAPGLGFNALIEGVWEEDASSYEGITSYYRHFWDSDEGYNTGWGGNDSAVTQAHRNFKQAIDHYQLYLSKGDANEKKIAYYWLGRTAHLLMDMSVPAHTLIDIHIPYVNDDQYEETSKLYYTDITWEDAIIDSLWPYPDFSDIPESLRPNADLSSLFYCLSDVSDDYDSDDRDGEITNGRYRWGRNVLHPVNEIRSVDFIFQTISGTMEERLVAEWDYRIESINGVRYIFYYKEFYDRWNQSLLSSVRVTYKDDSEDTFWAIDEVFGDVFKDVLQYQYMPKLMGRAIGYTAKLYKLFWEETHRSDLSGDGKVNLVDLAELSRKWLLINCTSQNNWCEGADINHSGSVGTEDLLIMAGDCLEGTIPVDMVIIPAGTFQMGDSKNEGGSGERPVHTVTVDSFAMGKYEITNGQYRDFLNSARTQGLITVNTNGIVYKVGSGTSYPYCDTTTSSSYTQIVVSNNTFSVRTKDGRDMTNDPMVEVSWYGAVAYCNWRSQKEGKQICYNLSTWNCDFSKKGYRLATEAEWEYAARGGRSGNRYPWGDTINQTQANFYSYDYSYDVSPVKNQCHPLWNVGQFPYTSPVGFFDGTLKYKTQYNWPGSATSYQTASGANAYGLYDMAGNVWEWCHDWYGSYSSSSQTNPTGPTTGTYRVLRGGGWYGYPYGDSFSSRVSCHIGHNPDYQYPNYGFRLVLDL